LLFVLLCVYYWDIVLVFVVDRCGWGGAASRHGWLRPPALIFNGFGVGFFPTL